MSLSTLDVVVAEHKYLISNTVCIWAKTRWLAEQPVALIDSDKENESEIQVERKMKINNDR